MLLKSHKLYQFIELQHLFTSQSLCSNKQTTTIQYNTMENLHSKTDCQFNLAHKLKRTETFKRKMK